MGAAEVVAMQKVLTVSSVLLGVSLLGCGLKEESAAVSSGRGAQLQLDLIDAPAEQLSEVVVTIPRVTAHSTSEGWVTVMDSTVTLHLLKLRDHAETLGVTGMLS